MIVVNGVLVSRYHLVLFLVSILQFHHQNDWRPSRKVVEEPWRRMVNK